MNKVEAIQSLGYCRGLIDKLHRDCQSIRSTTKCIEDYLDKITAKCEAVEEYIENRRIKKEDKDG